jgi:drug/metabolite transporter (DMT)-like permease
VAFPSRATTDRTRQKDIISERRDMDYALVAVYGFTYPQHRHLAHGHGLEARATSVPEMRIMIVVWLLSFYAFQIVAALLFKYGADHPEHFWHGFLAGNVFGASSIYFLMKLYTLMQVNLAGAIAGGGTFILAQFALVLVFRERLTLTQYVGLLAVTFGIVLVSYGKAPQPSEALRSSQVANCAKALISNS